MVCAYCNGPTEVSNSRRQRRANQIWRRRRCRRCGSTFTTHEAIDLSSSLFIDKNGAHKPFSADRLFTELLLALQDQPDAYLAAREASQTVIKRLLALPGRPFVPSTEVSRLASEVLKRLDKRAHLRYQAEHPSLQS